MASVTELAQNHEAEDEELMQLMQELYANGKISSSTVDRIERHAGLLGSRVCASFTLLHDILERHESLVRSRWIKKSTAQRRELLLTAWPGMERDYRPDDAWNPMPQINLENLTKAKPLLIFLNARGRQLPWSFASIEEEFLTMARTFPCTDEEFCKGTTVKFTRDTNPSTYGKINRDRDPEEPYRATDGYFEICARQAIQTLCTQATILEFLVKCACQILHDVSDAELFGGIVKEEPSTSELLKDDNSGDTTFSNFLSIAPYRGWRSLNFERLHGYIAATLGLQEEHAWALREDPSYFADTLREYEDHAPYKCKAGTQRPFQKGSLDSYRNFIVRLIVDESYCMLAGWKELDQRFATFGQHFQEDSNLHDQQHAIREAEHVAKAMYQCLATKIGESYLSAPNIRKLMTRKSDLDESYLEPKPNLTSAQHQLLYLFRGYELVEGEIMWKTPSFMSWSLESLDLFIRGNPECKEMVSERLMSLLSDLSVLGECLRQFSLWQKSPQVMAVQHGECDYTCGTEMSNFATWMSGMLGYIFPVHCIFPYEEKLCYPTHKRQTRESINVIRQSEANLDKFWADVDAMYERKTGMAQHPVLLNFFNECGDMQRTPPWIELVTPQPKLKAKVDYEYTPLSRMVHDRTMQITGSFDKLSFEEKTKAKTRGARLVDNGQGGGPVEPPVLLPEQELDKPFIVDQRTHKVFKTIFYTPTSNMGDLPKAVKWVEFKRAMSRVGFAVEKLHGSAWQFTPGDSMEAERNIQFHEPYPDSDVPYVMAKRFGRRLGRVYGWSANSFKLG